MVILESESCIFAFTSSSSIFVFVRLFVCISNAIFVTSKPCLMFKHGHYLSFPFCSFVFVVLFFQQLPICVLFVDATLLTNSCEVIFYCGKCFFVVLSCDSFLNPFFNYWIFFSNFIQLLFFCWTFIVLLLSHLLVVTC